MSEAKQKIIGGYSVDMSQVIGKGATGDVYRGFHMGTQEPVAVKAIQMSQVTNEVTQYLLEGEKKAMTSIKSPYIVKAHDIVQERDYCYLIMELCSGGTLKDYIQRKGKLTCSEVIELFRMIVTGYAAIIDGLFIHRDLKTANILLRGNMEPVIIDFGYCEMIMGKRPLIKYNVGSPSYMSPEAHSIGRYSEKSDIWALGVILYEMLTGKTLDNGLNIKEFFRNVESEGRVRLNTEGMSPVCIELLEAALKINPQERATIHKLKYIIDKSMIPQMQSMLKKTSSASQSHKHIAGSQKQLRVAPPAQFNYKQAKQPQQKQRSEAGEKNQPKVNFLTKSDRFVYGSQKLLPQTPSHSQGVTFGERNQQSVIRFTTQNVAQPHVPAILRKSVERNNPSQNHMQDPVIKKLASVNEADMRLSFKRIPVLQKAASFQDAISPASMRPSVVSLRII